MANIEIKAPAMGESIAEAVVAKWLVNVGDAVAADQLIAELETDKVNLEVSAPSAGVLTSIAAAKGATVKVGQLMGVIDSAATASAPKPAATAVAAPAAPAPASAALAASGPAVRKMAAEQGVSGDGLAGSGKGGRLLKPDLAFSPTLPVADTYVAPAASAVAAAPARPAGTREERVEMTRIRKTIASRLKQAQNTAAMLTTYNEVDLSAVNALRTKYKDAFEKKHGVKLGYMSFFTKAVVEALKEWPALNAEIDGETIVYKHYYDIGIAVSSDRGLVVPVVRGADSLSLSGIESAINDFGTRARSGGLKPDELSGASFSITNGGTFGSMLSMPILNFPQVGILGMHAIKDRPVVVTDEKGQKTIAIRPVMYVALTYDHRIVDGREAVSFLVSVKNALEDPARLVLGV